MLRPLCVIAGVLSAGLVLSAQRSPAPARTPGTRLSTDVTCRASLGTGIKSRRSFCDVIIATGAVESVGVRIPAHTGMATLFFDLHNRFSLPVVAAQPVLAYARHEAIVDVLVPSGASVGRAAVIREFRSLTDVFDQIGGGGRPGGVKAVAPGPAELVRLVVPAGVDQLAIVGVSLKMRTGLGGEQTYDTPGRPVAILSNVRVEYRPR